MERNKTLLLLTVGILCISSVYAQKKSLPTWLNGAWSNSGESNAEKFVDWRFSNDSIFYISGGFSKRHSECLNEKYRNHRKSVSVQKNVCRVSFSSGTEIVVYRFILQKVSYSKEPVMTYSLEINGQKKRNGLIFYKKS
jgi:hypothetical protein